MHNVLTLWYRFVVLKETGGKSFLAVYADDFIAGFQYKVDAERYYDMLKERLGKFNLELEESKSRLIEFGRHAEINCKRKGKRKPETVDFFGFMLNRRSQMKSYTWNGFADMLKVYPLAKPKIYVRLF